MSAKKGMRRLVENYLACRRRLGFQLKAEGEELLRFARYADEQGHTGPLTTDLAIAWAKLPPNVSRLYCARRLDVVRRLAQFRLIDDPATEVPPRGFFGPSYRRAPVHIYTAEQITALLSAAGQLRPAKGLRPRTFATLFGLLAATGLRISEALRLNIQDIDWSHERLTVQHSKFKGSRLLPLHASTVKALGAYDRFRRQYTRNIPSDAFFVTERGTRLHYRRTLMTFCGLRQKLGWDQFKPRPRIHDLRHTFAVRCLLGWYQSGENIDHHILALQTYLGHKKITDTYWYLSGIPALMALGAARFERFVQKGGSLHQ